MPVTAKLSRKFYEVLGDDVANELVEWFNQVDATYRADWRDLNEVGFARFDAKLEQRAAQLDARVDRLGAELHAKIDRLREELHATIDRRAAELDAKIDQRSAQLEVKIAQSETRVLSALHAVKADLLKWMFGTIFAAWATLLGAMIALIKFA
ncbi:MAG: DUF1640 domain-containing protein [Gemmatimonadetes bacterium]|nr:DUF1640 domain-containing protein [Gemmatimonadota bacterium]